MSYLINKLTLLLLSLFFANPVIAAEQFVMGFGQDPEKSPQYHFYRLVYSEVFQTLGYEFSYHLCPNPRCSLLANSGIVDGEPQRIRTYAEMFPNLLRVDEPVFINRTRLFAREQTSIESVDRSLRNPDYRIEYVRGSIWTRLFLTPLVAPERLTDVATYEQALQRLVLGRADILVALEAPVLALLQTPEFDEAGIRPVGIVGRHESFPYIHDAYADKATDIAKALKQMKESGRYDVLLEQTMPFLLEIDEEQRGKNL